MNRRDLFRSTTGVLGLTLIGGCSDLGILESDSLDGDPEPELPPESAILSLLEGDWERGDPDSISAPMIDDAAHVAVFTHDADDERMGEVLETYPRVEIAGQVIVSIWTHDNEETAEDRYQNHADQRYAFDDADVAAESIVGGVSPNSEPPRARVLFRDTDAVGWISYWSLRQSSPSAYETTAIELAEEVHDRWRNESSN